MSILDFLKRRKQLTCRESEGTNLAIQAINEFEKRSFVFKGTDGKYAGLNKEELIEKIQDEIDRQFILYRYKSKIKTYKDNKNIQQAEIKLIGKAGIMNRYNPMDIEMTIATESPT